MNSLFKFFIERFRVTYILIIGATLMGLNAISSLPKEADPEVKVPYAIVTTIYPGASPSDMENLVTRKIEEKLDSLEDLKKMTSSSNFGVSSISVEFEADADLDNSIDELKDKVDEAKVDLPDNAEEPIVTEVSMSDIPIVTFSLSNENMSDDHLIEIAEDIESELEKIKGVSKVNVLGKREKEVKVLLDRNKLSGLNLSAGQVVQKIQQSHIDFPLGEVVLEDVNISLRLEGQFEGAEDLKNLPIISGNTGTIFLQDIAEVFETREKEESKSFLSIKGGELGKTISLQVHKKTGGNIIEIVDTSKQELEKMKEQGKLPNDLKIEISNDNSQFIRDDLDTLVSNGFSTIIIVAVLLLIALGWRESLIASLSIPMAFLLTFATMKFQGGTINSMSLFSLVLSLGLLVDNTIVITEGIFDNVNIRKMNSKDAAYNSAKTFWKAITSGTMTTVSAFVPMLLVSGIMGEYMSVIPLTIAPTLIWSLVVALFFVPCIATKLFKNAKTHEDFKETKFTHFARSRLERTLRYLAKHRKARVGLFSGLFALFIGALYLPASGIIPVEMFPAYDADYFNINFEMPPGTSLEATHQEALPVTKILRKNKHVDNFLFAVGAGAVGNTGGSIRGGGGVSNSNTASFTVNLTRSKEREITSFEIAEQVRKEINKIKTSGKIKIDELQAGPPSGKPIEVRIFGDDIHEMEIITKAIKSELEQIEGAIEIEDNISLSAGEFIFKLNKEKINFYGLNPSTVAMELRTSIFGTDAAEIARGEDDININVAINWENEDEKPKTISEIESLQITTPKGKINIRDIAEVKLEQGFANIDHEKRKKILRVQSSLQAGYAVKEKLAELEQRVKEHVEVPSNIEIEFGGSTEDIDQSFSDLFNSMIVAIILIAFILVLQFQSFVQPLIILLALPMALIGVLGGFFLINWPISFPSFIGIVSLSGIVINDAIVLIDRINEKRNNGETLEKAVVESGGERMKPIFLTSITTIFGILPLSLSDPIWGGLGFSVVFGLMFSTFLTLVVVPTLFYVFEFKNEQRKILETKMNR
ncbi:MAG: efflux RND transporter permease subunit [Candidatus Gracilibacteria bacterium]|jgi:multidrug efflux pump subunit AcrB|nr:efflux RND transporter permease subunit [Candidatus Gracilibacteria bacterium]